jgi:hypothetical protein
MDFLFLISMQDCERLWPCSGFEVWVWDLFGWLGLI